MAENSVHIIQQYHAFSLDFPAFHLDYTQDYRPESELHYHNCMEIGFVVSGKGTMIINNTVSSFEKGTVTVISEGCIHDDHIVTQCKEEATSVWKFIFVKPELLGLSNVTDFAGFASSNEKLVSLFHMMFSELETAEKDFRSLFCSLLDAFLRYAERIAPKGNAIVPYMLSSEMATAMNNIQFNYNSPLSLEDMARSCNMSVSSFCRTFKSYFNVAPITYLNNLRLTVAKQLLETTDTPILDISSFVGYGSLSSFNRLFLKKYSLTPREVRKQARK